MMCLCRTLLRAENTTTPPTTAALWQAGFPFLDCTSATSGSGFHTSLRAILLVRMSRGGIESFPTSLTGVAAFFFAPVGFAAAGRAVNLALVVIGEGLIAVRTHFDRQV